MWMTMERLDYRGTKTVEELKREEEKKRLEQKEYEEKLKAFNAHFKTEVTF